MAENKPLTFILSDESVNCYGYRVLTDGIDLSLFEKNPLMLWNHSRAFRGTKDEVLPIGHWENIRKEGDRLLADAVFDEKDEFAQAVKSKVEQGILRMASIGFSVVATSEDKDVLVPGQTRPTVIKCLVKESSVTDIGGNRNALRLYDEFGDEINLSDAGNHLLPLLDQGGESTDTTNQKQNMELREKIAVALKLSDVASDEILLTKLQDMGTEIATLTERVRGYEQAEAEAKAAEARKLVDDAIRERRLTESDRALFERQALENYDDTKAILSKLPAAENLGDTEGDRRPARSAWEERLSEIDENKRKNQ